MAIKYSEGKQNLYKGTFKANFGHFWPFQTLFGNLHGLVWVKNSSKQPQATCSSIPSGPATTLGKSSWTTF